MIIKGTLSLSQKERGRKNYNRFNLVNGLSYMCLGETIIILFAMKLDCPDYILSALAAFIFLGNFAMPLGKWATSRVGAARTVSTCWALRNIAAITVASASVVYFFWGSTPAITLILIGTFLFYACRSAGTVIMQPMIGEITTGENRGKFISETNRLFYFACLVSLAVIMLVLRYNQSIWTLTAIIIVGSLLGFTSATFLYRIDETEELRNSAKEPILDGARKTLQDRNRRVQLITNLSVSALIAMSVPISMVALKRGYGVSDTNALLFALIQFTGAIGTSYIIGMLTEESGPRPILLIFFCSIIFVCLCWVFAPLTFKWQFMIWPFLFGGAASNGTGIALMQYFLITIPSKERMAASLTIYVASGVFAGLIAMILGGSMLNYFDGLFGFDVDPAALAAVGLKEDSFWFTLFPIVDGHLPQLHVYRLYFGCVGILALFGFIPILELKPYSKWRVKDILGLVFAPRDIIALYNLNKFNELANPREEVYGIDRLLESRSHLSEKALLASLDSPKLALRSRALLAISELAMSQTAKKAVLRELKNGEHTTANIAAQICGNHKLKEAIPLLREYLGSTSDYYLKSKAMVALVQLEDTESYPLIERIFIETGNPRLIMHGAAALAEMNDPKSLRLLLNKTMQPGISGQTLVEILCSIAEIAGFGDEFYKFIKLYRKDSNSAVQMLSEFCLIPARGVDKFNIASSLSEFNYSERTKHEMIRWLLSFRKDTGNESDVVVETVNFLSGLQEPDNVCPELIFCLAPIMIRNDEVPFARNECL